MKKGFFCFALIVSCGVSASAGFVTLIANSDPERGPVVLNAAVAIGTNEIGQVVSSAGGGGIYVIKGGITNNFSATHDVSSRPIVVAGPAIFQMNASDGYCTVKIEPEAFPPGQTLILPAGTIGVVHVESSTNLVQWKDEWTQTFSNTNENRFFRIRAERSLP
jgi:hypothetical protein